MMNLAEYRPRSQRLADFLPWAALVERGVILKEDGSFQRTARFRGPDLDSATPAELSPSRHDLITRFGAWVQAGPSSLRRSAFPLTAIRSVNSPIRSQR